MADEDDESVENMNEVPVPVKKVPPPKPPRPNIHKPQDIPVYQHNGAIGKTINMNPAPVLAPPVAEQQANQDNRPRYGKANQISKGLIGRGLYRTEKAIKKVNPEFQFGGNFAYDSRMVGRGYDRASKNKKDFKTTLKKLNVANASREDKEQAIQHLETTNYLARSMRENYHRNTWNLHPETIDEKMESYQRELERAREDKKTSSISGLIGRVMRN